VFCIRFLGSDCGGENLQAVMGMETTYTWIIRLKQRNLDTFILEVALGLRKVQWGMVWRSVPITR